jgi:hypothetical protein
VESRHHPGSPFLPSGSYRCQFTALEGVFPCLEECLDFLKKNPEENENGDPAFYGLSEKIANKSVVFEFIIYSRERYV